MKKITLATLTLGFLSLSAFAHIADNLQARLLKLENLTADYEQVLTTTEGKLVQEGRGTLQLKRPDFFRVESNTSQENIIVSDGKTLWFYDPFVEQVTARKLQAVLDNTPFALIAHKDKAQWQKYVLSQNGDTFTLTPKDKKSPIKYFTLTLNEKGDLLGFSTLEKNGQKNTYTLKNNQNTPISAQQFQFKVPEGAELDDQR